MPRSHNKRLARAAGLVGPRATERDPGFSAKVLLSALSARGHFCEKPGSLSVALVPSGYAQLTMIVESSRAAPWRLAASSPTVTS